MYDNMKLIEVNMPYGKYSIEMIVDDREINCIFPPVTVDQYAEINAEIKKGNYKEVS